MQTKIFSGILYIAFSAVLIYRPVSTLVTARPTEGKNLSSFSHISS